MKFKRLMLIVFAIGFCTNCGAAAFWGDIYCGEWVKADKYTRGGYETWLLGYLSGYALYHPEKDVLKGSEPKSIYLWMDNYCNGHPLNHVIDGASELIEELKKRTH